ncbi:hypothetical protein KFZ70_04150 [Tamlana fucoidanivorans]|uniref:Uracil-DNA glycosylase-like domain-containing protein n=1 Tax=Allotamlana fucoidanivorans TaxID=2583814 RepID=A0A5C4SCQ5_9FLAO|nr:hypothetical protein [Tamlana fucoidanivorans]TNJ41102.1 hypothetical protein FGF67_16475 [Tamlana fucoidanivorans]
MNDILSIEKEFKNEIDNIWNDTKYSEIDIIERGYGIHDKIIKNSILFIGINPSFTKKAKNGSYFINLDQDAKRTIEGKPYVYFKKFVDITKKINNNSNSQIKWSHMDLLFHRETKQHFIEKIKKQKNGIEFINEQLKISRKIIIKSKPKIIVVSNTKARDYLKNKTNCSFDFKFDNELGTEIIKNNSELNNVPVFFTSMLTGQRALDNGSYERLIWHINYVLEKINKKPVANNV